MARERVRVIGGGGGEMKRERETERVREREGENGGESDTSMRTILPCLRSLCVKTIAKECMRHIRFLLRI